MKPGIIVAMQKEAELLRQAGIKDITLSGIGKVNAAAAATELILSRHPDIIINTGVAGSMDPGLKSGDIVVARRVAYHDVWCGEGVPVGCVQGQPRFFEASGLLLAACEAFSKGPVPMGAAACEAVQSEEYIGASACTEDVVYLQSGRNIRFGLVVSGDQFYIGPEEDSRIKALYPDALACDMESAAVAQVCRRFSVPFLSIRVISDEHSDPSVQARSYEDFWKKAPEFSSSLVLKLVEFLGKYEGN